MRLDGKVAVVTGAGSGIGRSIATVFHREGAKVVLADISGREKELAEELGSGAIAVRADVTHSGDVQAMTQAAVAGFGRLDVLCNNAGIDGVAAPLSEYPEDQFDQVMAVNVRGTFLGMRYAIPEMLKNGGGSIINMASIGGLVALPTLVAYSASKGAVLQMTRVSAVEYGAAGIRVNTICPGAIDTPLVREFDPAFIEQITAMTPQHRIADVEEVAAVALFLASDESSFVTGSHITVDGGYTAL
jgi:NAD(P)-dependent dehydrogenase (short-subunit alcohol dehydrogenase family)